MLSDEPLSVGIIGVGMQGHGHVVNFSNNPRAEVRAICDIDEQKLQKEAQDFDVPLQFEDFHEMLGCDEVDAVAIVLPDYLHREAAVAALEQGKHVLLEKPMALSLGDAGAIVEAAEEGEGCFMLNLSNRWMYPFSKGKGLLDNGDIGDVWYVFARLSNRIDVPTELLPWLEQSHLAHWIGVHRLDIARWWIGREAQRVRAVHRKGVLSERGFDAADFYQATIEFEGGAVLSLEGSWILPSSYPSLVDSRFYALCSNGVIDVDRMRSELAVADGKEFKMSTPTNGPTLDQAAGFTFAASRHFVDCALEGKPPLTGAEEGLALTKILCALVESARQDGKVMEL
ncbi:MAG: Gfo/Idh/MocA family protein [Candidatus Brocadiia bacterium]